MNEDDKQQDKFVCINYEKTGVCSKGEMCNKVHRSDPMSRIVLFKHLYPDPDIFLALLPEGTIMISEEQKQRAADAFYYDVFLMCQRFGPVEDIVIAANKTDIMTGNVLVSFKEVDAAHAAVLALNNQYYAGRKIHCQLTPIQRLSGSLCREPNCPFGDTCNYIHAVNISENVMKACFPRLYRVYPSKFRRTNKFHVLTNPAEILNGTMNFNPN